MYNQTHVVQKFLNGSFLSLFFLCMLYFILLDFQMFFMNLNIFLHLTHIYAKSFNFLLTWKWPKIGRNVVFLSLILTVLGFNWKTLTYKNLDVKPIFKEDEALLKCNFIT